MKIEKIFLPPILSLLLISTCCTKLGAQNMMENSSPPKAEEKPQLLEAHGEKRTDMFYWLRDKENPKVLDYLKAENDYTDAMMDSTKKLQDDLYWEMRNRIKVSDSTAPYKKGSYYYYSNKEENKEYSIHCRKKGTLSNKEEVILDENRLAEGLEFSRVGAISISENENILAYSHDTNGRRMYTLYFKNLSTGDLLKDKIYNIDGDFAWASDNKTLFYVRQDEQTLRPYQVYKHILGTEVSKDTLVYEEKDETFGIAIEKSRSGTYIFLISSQTLSTEFQYIHSDKPNSAPVVILPRKPKHEYTLDHMGDSFYILTNSDAKNFRIVKMPVEDHSQENWKEIVPHRSDVFLKELYVFKNHLVRTETKEFQSSLVISDLEGSGSHLISFQESAYDTYLGKNPEVDTDVVRYNYTSLTTPHSVYDYDMRTHQSKLIKREHIVGDFSPENYTTERLFAKARDGVKVPISIVYKKGMNKDGNNPLLLNGYGSYGLNLDPYFNSKILSLLDRGFVFAIAHIRGGQELGRQWYENGKLLKKKNTFTDFIDSADFLIKEKYTKSDKIFAIGGSAGGLLMGAVVNMRPDLFKGVIAMVPFVDVITTMLDESIPLTTFEYDEWGNPNKKEHYDYMMSYSPYDNIEKKAYPNLFVTAGLNDDAVGYWEPAKWVAKLRSNKTDKNLLLLQTNMGAGHSGSSGRFNRLKEYALHYSFLISLAEKP